MSQQKVSCMSQKISGLSQLYQNSLWRNDFMRFSVETDVLRIVVIFCGLAASIQIDVCSNLSPGSIYKNGFCCGRWL